MLFDVLNDLCSYYADILEINTFLLIFIHADYFHSSHGPRRGGVGVDYRSHPTPLRGQVLFCNKFLHDLFF